MPTHPSPSPAPTPKPSHAPVNATTSISGGQPDGQPAAPQELSQESVHIIFYCKDCHNVVEAMKVGKKYVYRCPTCNAKNVAFGTEKSIRSFYHLK